MAINARSTLLVGFLAMLLATGCGAKSTPTPAAARLFVTPTPGPAPASPSVVAQPAVADTAPPIPTPIATGTPTTTATPTQTATPTATGTPTATPTPHAVVNSPGGTLNVRSGPGLVYDPPLGAYTNGAAVPVLGKQYSPEGELWWLIPFAGSPAGRGWIYASHTSAAGVDNVPWVTAPPTPTPTITPTPSPTPRPHAVINSPDGFLQVRRGPGFEYDPPLGAYQNGTVAEVMGKQYSTKNNLWWLIPFPEATTGQGWLYAGYTVARHTDNVPWVSAPPPPTPPAGLTPMPTAPLTPQPVVTWQVYGRVVAGDTARPVAGAVVEVRLGVEAVLFTTATGQNGEFFVEGQARNAGSVTLSITAPAFAPRTQTLGPATPRVYHLPHLQLLPQNLDCRYESVLDVTQNSGMSRLQSLGFTTVLTTTVPALGDSLRVGRVISQSPQPPSPDQLVKLPCVVPITLGIGME